MLLDKGVTADHEVDVIGGEQFLQFQAVYPRGVGFFHVEVIMVVVVLIHDADPHGFGVSKGAVINSIDI